MNAECRQYRARFSEYLDDALAEAKREALETHLESCERCRGELAALRRTVDSVRELPVLRAPETFAAGVRERLARRERSRERRLVRLLWARALPVAAMFLLVFGATFLVSRNGLFRPRTERPRLAMEQAGRAATERARVEKALTDETLWGAQAGPLATPVAVLAEREGAPGAPAPAAEPPAAMAMRRGLAGEADSARRQSVPRQLMARMRPHLREELKTRARQRLMFNQVAAAPPAARQGPHQILDVTAERPTEILVRTVDAANRRGVRAVVEVAEDGTVDVYLDVPPEDYTDLLRELAAMTEPAHQSLRNTTAGKGMFFGEVLNRYSAYQNAPPGPARDGILRCDVTGVAAGTPEAAASRAPMELRMALPERGKAGTEARPAPVNLQVSIRPQSPRSDAGE